MKSKPTSFSLTWLATTFGLAAAYFLVGKLALLLAIPPGYATPVWPAAGIALAGLLLFGFRMWPGVFIGSFLVNVSTALDTTSMATILQTLLLPISIGIGSVLQATAGAFLIRRLVGFPLALYHPTDILKSMAIGGPVSCLISATVGVASMLFTGSLDVNQFTHSWGIWWLGDTIGVLIVMPLVSIWGMELQEARLRTHVLVGLPLCIGVLLTVIVFLEAREGEWRSAQMEFERRTDIMAQALKKSIESKLEIVQSIVALFDSTPKVERNQFHTFVEPLFQRHLGLHGLSWNAPVSRSQRTAYENAAHRDGYSNFSIMEQDAQGQLVPAGDHRDEYVVVYYMEPYKTNEKALGYDLASDPTRAKVLDRARDTGEVIATPPITLVQESEHQPGFLFFAPIYRKGLPHNTVEERRQNLHSFTSGVFRAGEMVEEALRGFVREGINYRIIDTRTPNSSGHLYVSRSSATETPAAPIDYLGQLHWATSFAIAGRQWAIEFWPTSKYATIELSGKPWGILTGGLFFTSLLGAFLAVLAGRAARIERVVAERTAELSETNISLTKEISNRKEAEKALQKGHDDLEHRIEMRTRDLAKANQELQMEIYERKRAELSLMERNRMLALDSDIGQVLNQSKDLPTLLQNCTEALVQHLDVAFARIWTLNSKEQVLELRASAGIYTHLDGPHSRVPLGHLKIGQIAAEKKSHLTNAVIGDPRVPEQEWAKREGLVAFAGYPLVREQEVVGVMALFSKHPLTEFSLNSLAVVADHITTAIQREMAMEENQRLAKYSERILASAGEGIYGLDLEGKATFLNPAAAKMLGYKVEELLGVPIHSAVHHTRPDGSPYSQEACPMYAAFKDGIVHHFEDEVLWRKDGTSFPVEYTSTPIRDEHDNIIGAVVTFSDITDRKQAEETIRESEARLNEAQRIGGIGSWELDLVTNKLIWSDEIYRIFEMDPKCFGSSYEAFLETVHPEDRASVNHAYTDSLKNKTQYDIVHRLLFSDERIKFVQERCENFYDDEGNPVRSLGTVQDITEIKRAEEKIVTSNDQLRELNLRLQTTREEECKRIAGELHDEFGQALTGLKFDLAWLAKQSEKRDGMFPLNVFKKKIRGMSSCLDATIKSVRRIATSLRPTILDDLGLVAALEWLTRDFRGRTGLSCQLKIDPHLMQKPLDSNHATALFRVSQEFLTNVMRHAQASEVRLRLREDADGLHLEMQDNGKGITDFDVTKPGALGIQGMRERVGLLGGQFTITGQSGKGTMLRVRLPVSYSPVPAKDSTYEDSDCR